MTPSRCQLNCNKTPALSSRKNPAAIMVSEGTSDCLQSWSQEGKNISIYRINRTFHFWMHYIRHFDFLQLLQNLPLYYYLEQLMKRNIFIKNQQASIQLNFSIFLPFSRQTRENYWENISSVLQSFNKGHLASHSKTLHLKKFKFKFISKTRHIHGAI